MRFSTIVGILVLVVTLAAGHPAQANIAVNGGFETGDFTGWSTTGQASIENGSLGTGPVEGTKQALLQTDPGLVQAFDIENFLGLSSGSLDSLATPSFAVEGAAIKQSFVVPSAGWLFIDFSWNFLTDEDPFSSVPNNNDYAFVSIVGPSTSNLFKLADVTSPLLGATGAPFLLATNFQNFSFFTASALPGTYTLGLGVMDVGDDFLNSGLAIDAVSVATPEPSSILLLGSGLSLLWESMRRKAQNEKA
jgi:hypothetical protein